MQSREVSQRPNTAGQTNGYKLQILIADLAAHPENSVIIFQSRTHFIPLYSYPTRSSNILLQSLLPHLCSQRKTQHSQPTIPHPSLRRRSETHNIPVHPQRIHTRQLTPPNRQSRLHFLRERRRLIVARHLWQRQPTDTPDGTSVRAV